MSKWIIRITICLSIGWLSGWFCYREYIKSHKITSENGKALKVYQGQWIEDIRKIGDFWSVGYVEIVRD